MKKRTCGNCSFCEFSNGSYRCENLESGYFGAHVVNMYDNCCKEHEFQVLPF